MTVLDQLRRGLGTRSADTVVRELFDGLKLEKTAAGEGVSVDRALGLPAVYSAISLIANVGGTLPLAVYDGKKRAVSHPAWSLLHDRPNLESTAAQFWPDALLNYSGWGNAYIGKKRVKQTGRVAELYLMPSDTVIPQRKDGVVTYVEHRGSERVRWAREDVIHVRNLSRDGLNGLSPIALARESMGMSLAMVKHSAKFFRDAAVPPGALRTEQKLQPETKELIRTEWRKRHGDNREIAILDAGAEFKTISVPLEDAQFVQLMGFGIADVARIFSLPASMIGGPTGDTFTYGNRESDMRLFSTISLAGPLMRFEAALSSDPDIMGSAYYARFVREALLQADFLVRMQGYRLATGGKGWMLPEEVRDFEDLPDDVELPDQEPAAAPPVDVPATPVGK